MTASEAQERLDDLLDRAPTHKEWRFSEELGEEYKTFRFYRLREEAPWMSLGERCNRLRKMEHEAALACGEMYAPWAHRERVRR